MIDRNVEAPIAIKAMCELPVDMIFLSISFLIAYIISTETKQSQGLLYWIVYLIIAVGVVFFWRRSILIYEKGKNKSWLFLLAINLFVTITCLMISINLLQDLKQQNDVEEPNKIENNGTTD